MEDLKNEESELKDAEKAAGWTKQPDCAFPIVDKDGLKIARKRMAKLTDAELADAIGYVRNEIVRRMDSPQPSGFFLKNEAADIYKKHLFRRMGSVSDGWTCSWMESPRHSAAALRFSYQRECAGIVPDAELWVRNSSKRTPWNAYCAGEMEPDSMLWSTSVCSNERGKSSGELVEAYLVRLEDGGAEAMSIWTGFVSVLLRQESFLAHFKRLTVMWLKWSTCWQKAADCLEDEMMARRFGKHAVKV